MREVESHQIGNEGITLKHLHLGLDSCGLFWQAVAKFVSIIIPMSWQAYALFMHGKHMLAEHPHTGRNASPFAKP